MEMGAKGSIRPDVAFRMLASNRKANAKEREMGKKKAQTEVTENQHEVALPTVVESSETEVFAQPEQLTEKPAPKPKVSKRPYIALVESHLELGDMDRKSLLELVLKEFPSVTKGGIGTFITDLKNVKYSHFKPRVAVEHPTTKKFIFADKVETQVVEAPVEAEAPVADVVVPAEEEQPEQPSE
jgi:hypothetical protein